jgi:hypothetical protein
MSEVSESADHTGEAPFVPPQPEELARLLPSYEVSHLLALGGMGAVYSGMQRDLERPVAIKVLPPDAVRDTESIDRFRTEAKAMARLTHPHIPAVYDFAVVEGFGVLVMELVEGPNVYALIHQKQMPPERALQILAEVCDAVQFAHSRGVIHGDIKPGNIMLDTDGRVKLADFGLARLMVQEDRNADSWTPMGTPEYAAPELYDKNTSPDHRADIYSLGVVLHEMLTGAPPVGEFDLPGAAMGLDPRVDEVIARCMELQPENRYQSAAEVRAVLLEVIDHRNVPVPEPAKGATRRIFRPGRKVPAGAKRRASQRKLAPVTQVKLAPGPATVLRGSGPPTVAPAARRRRKVVVVEGARSRGRGGEHLTRNILIAAAALSVIAALWFILTRGGGSKTDSDRKRAEETKTAPSAVTPPPEPATETPASLTQNDPPRPAARPEPRVEPKAELKPSSPPPSKVHARLHEMKVSWRDEWNSKVEAKVAAEMAGVSSQYAEALRKLEDELLAKGDAASVLAVREESKRFEKERTGLKPEAVSSIPPLATLQNALTARLEKLRAGVKYDADLVKEKYMNALQELERRMDDDDDAAGSKIAADEFSKVAPLTDTALRDYFNAAEKEN